MDSELPSNTELKSKKSSEEDEVKVTKEKSKFVLKQEAPKSKPPPLVSGEKVLESRKDVRYSKDHGRFSFDVDVAGPFYTKIDPKKKKPRMRNVGTQAILKVESVGPDFPLSLLEEMGSQTEFEDLEEDEREPSFSSDGQSNLTDTEAQEGAGDASSSSQSQSLTSDSKAKKKEASKKRISDASKKSMKSGSGKAGSKGGKTLERKESKRRDAETMARPRGYRDLNLKEENVYVTFEAETTVTSHDLEKEMAKSRGLTLPKDNILWPTCEEFDIETAIKKIEDYIKTCWKLDSKWLWVTQPIEVYHDDNRKKFVYEVKFSIPSPTTPVPPATASVFFVFEIPLYTPRDEPVLVSYVLEGNRFAHQPGKMPFQDKWLQGIIADKIRIQKLVNF